MRFSSVTLLLAGLASGINARYVDTWEDEILPTGFLGTFDTFTNRDCGEGGKGVTVSTENHHGRLQPNVQSIKAYMQERPLWIYDSGRILRIQPGDYNCYQLYGRSSVWKV